MLLEGRRRPGGWQQTGRRPWGAVTLTACVSLFPPPVVSSPQVTLRLGGEGGETRSWKIAADPRRWQQELRHEGLLMGSFFKPHIPQMLSRFAEGTRSKGVCYHAASCTFFIVGLSPPPPNMPRIHLSHYPPCYAKCERQTHFRTNTG